MNTPKINFQDQIQKNPGLFGNFTNHSSQYFTNQQNCWNMGICMQPQPQPVMDAASQLQNIRPDISTSCIMNRFESPAPAFYATEHYVGLHEYDCQIPSYADNYSTNSAEQTDHNFFELKTSLQSTVRSQCTSENYNISFDKSYKGLRNISSANRLHPHDRNRLIGNDAAYVRSHFLVGCNLYDSLLAQLSFTTSPRFCCGGVSVSSGNHVSNGAVLSSKTRIRWTQDLHEKFVECVNLLGGAEKATPKAILKLMDSDGLTIVHVKSHLQKYRTAKHLPDSEGKADEKTNIDDISQQLNAKTGFRFLEALQLQLDVQRHLQEQLEIQRDLQLRIEEQGRQLKMIFDQQQKRTNNLFRNQNMDAITSPDRPFSIEDVEVSIAEGCNNTHFRPMIS